MSKLVVHLASAKLLASLTNHPPHAVLLQGPLGVGLLTISRDIANQLTDEAYIIEIIPSDGTITIDTIRTLYDQARVRHEKLTVIIIDDADAMGIEAQNALLKLLEEPTSNLMFILTSHASQLLLPTILSRVETIDIKPVSTKQTHEFMNTLHKLDETKTRQVIFLANGLPAEITRFITDDEYFSQHVQLATDARQLIGGQKLDMLSIVHKYSNRSQAILLLGIIGKLTLHTLYKTQDKRVAQQLTLIDETLSRVYANGNVKLQLYRLVSKW